MPGWETTAAAAIFCATLAAVLARPYRISEAYAALAGAVAMVLAGVVSPSGAIGALGREWNVYLFFFGLMTIAAVAERAGVFDMLATTAARWGRGRSLRLFVAVFALGTLITAFLSNDATALVLTPVVYTLVRRLGLPPMPYLFACTFIADTASFLLPVSNPINVLVLGDVPLGDFVRFLLVPAAFAVVCNLLVFTWYFRDVLRARYDLALIDDPPASTRPFRRATLAALVVTALAYVVASTRGAPLGLVATGGAALLLAVARWHRALDWSSVRRGISWSLFGFITGLFVLVRGVEEAGITGALGQAILAAGGESPLRSTLLVAAGTALGANVINNVPMALVMRSALASTELPPHLSSSLPYAAVLGADLGPNLTTIGSLATVLWVLLLRHRGLEVSQREYLKLGLTVVPLMVTFGAVYIALVTP